MLLLGTLSTLETSHPTKQETFYSSIVKTIGTALSTQTNLPSSLVNVGCLQLTFSLLTITSTSPVPAQAILTRTTDLSFYLQ